MFKETNKKMNKTVETNNYPSVNMISQGTEIVGTVITKNDLRVSGKVDGKVRAEGKTILTNSGFIKGDLQSAEADIAGKVEGEILVTNKLILRQSAIVKGDIQTKVLLVEEGAVFEGDCKMGSNPLKDKKHDESNKEKEIQNKTKVIEQQ